MSKLTKGSRGKDCIRCGAPNAFAAHYNGPRQMAYGKGRGIKCSDIMSADFCHECDQEFTEGSTSLKWASKWERSEDFLHWIALTNIRRLENGVLEVK